MPLAYRCPLDLLVILDNPLFQNRKRKVLVLSVFKSLSSTCEVNATTVKITLFNFDLILE